MFDELEEWANEFVSFDNYVGTLVFFNLLGKHTPIDIEPFVIVTVSYETTTNTGVPLENVVPQTFISAHEHIDEALSDMDFIQSDRCTWFDQCGGVCPWELTVIKMSYQGDTVVWRDYLPMTPVGL